VTILGAVFVPNLPPERLTAVAQLADEAGLEELWLWEDCFRESGIAAAAAALARTERLRVGVGLLPVPLRNVALLAMELATLHRMFPGRVLAGVGHGVQDWMGQAGVRVESPLTLLEEYVTALVGLLRGETVTMSGRYVRLDRVGLDWPPVPPGKVFVGGVGERTLRLAGKVGDGTILVAGTPPDRVREVRERVPDGHVLTVNVDARTLPRDAEAIAEGVRRYADAGADRVVLQPAPDERDPEGFVGLVGAG
jgi:alkanesulfonate monooxygenase SsuD/methylene tetrahydromethanopterin reductase-like flavin-dependent oxidoreductase (luciferase family)